MFIKICCIQYFFINFETQFKYLFDWSNLILFQSMNFAIQPKDFHTAILFPFNCLILFINLYFQKFLNYFIFECFYIQASTALIFQLFKFIMSFLLILLFILYFIIFNQIHFYYFIDFYCFQINLFLWFVANSIYHHF